MAVVVTRMPAGTLPSEDWVCSICLENGPNDLVVHAPPLHPFHRMCLVNWLNRNTICPNCRIPLDASGILTPLERCLIASKRAINQIRSREHFMWEGLAIYAIGIIAQNATITAIGSAVVFRTLYRHRRDNPSPEILNAFNAIMCTFLLIALYESYKAASPPVGALTEAVCYVPPPRESTRWERVTSYFSPPAAVPEPATSAKIVSLVCSLISQKGAPPPMSRSSFFF